MNNTYVLEGGVGKHIAFTSLLSKLVERDGSPVQVYTPYTNVFAGNPLVKMAFDSNTLPIDDPRILESDNIIFVEPYKSNFKKGHQSLIESYCELLGLEFDNSMKPSMVTDHHKEQADELLDSIDKNFVVVQFSGGQTTVGFNPNQQYQNLNAGRNYPNYLANTVCTYLKQQLDVEVLNWSLPNELPVLNTIPLDVNISTLHQMLESPKCVGFISIDSSLPHIAAAANKTGVVVWGNTSWKQYGYEHNTNMTIHHEGEWDTAKFDPNDPRNIMVEPKHVVDVFMEKHNAG